MVKKKIISFVVVLIVVIVGGGVYRWQKSASTEPLSYSTADISVSVSQETASFDYTVDDLVAMAEECGRPQSASYFTDLVTKFSGATKNIYNFKYNGESQEPDTFVVTLLPNITGYSSLAEFKTDFDQCYAGGEAYPRMLNNNWLLFVNSCGTGFSDGSGLPIGCQKASEIIEPSLQLK